MGASEWQFDETLRLIETNDLAAIPIARVDPNAMQAAALLTAAPELLAALEALVAALPEMATPDEPLNGADAVDALCGVWPSITAAIAAARGVMIGQERNGFVHTVNPFPVTDAKRCDGCEATVDLRDVGRRHLCGVCFVCDFDTKSPDVPTPEDLEWVLEQRWGRAPTDEEKDCIWEAYS